MALLHSFNRKVIQTTDFLSRFFYPYPFYRRPLKLLYVHGTAYVGITLLMPPPADIPPIAIPINFAASFCLAYIVTALRIV